jgi:superfamily I DNA and RNA helicase
MTLDEATARTIAEYLENELNNKAIVVNHKDVELVIERAVFTDGSLVLTLSDANTQTFREATITVLPGH